jgi:nicotinamidase-related amidase
MEISRDEDLSVLRKAFDAARAVHVGIDIQHYYCDPRFGNPNDKSWYGLIGDTVKRIDEFTAATRAKLPPVWVNQSAFGVTAPNLEDCGALRGAAVLLGGVLSHIFSTKTQIARRAIYGAHAQPQDDVVGKPLIDGFEKSRLDGVLRRKGADTLVLTGFFTDQCVKATALTAKKKGYEVFLAEDATLPADYSPGECRAMMRAHGVRVVAGADIVRLCRQG